jgi:large subunit ribosomal protein L9
MEVILLKKVDNLGVKNDVVKVKPGYGRNYLIPQGMAIVANASNVKHIEEIKKQQSAKLKKQLEELRSAVDSLQNKTIKIGAKAGSNGKLFGSVTSIQIAEAIKNQTGTEVERRKVSLYEEVKTLGTYKAKVEFHKEVIADVTFEVVED